MTTGLANTHIDRSIANLGPDKTDIKFAVPTQKSAANFESADIDIPNEIAPGNR